MFLRVVASFVIAFLVVGGTCNDQLRSRHVDEFGDDVTLECFPNDHGVTFRHWITPDLVVIDANFSRSDDIQILPNNSLYLPYVERENLGDYICYTTDADGSPVYFKTTLYLNVPSTWEIYKDEFILAICISAGTFVLLTLLCIGYAHFVEKKYHAERNLADPYLDGDATVLPVPHKMTERDTQF